MLVRGTERILVISKFALDCRQYHSDHKAASWKTCTLRKWLNDSFLNTAFNEIERSLIVSTNIRPDKQPYGNVAPEQETTDRVFLLSLDEAKRFFTDNNARQCSGTAYCYAQGSANFNGYCYWWLRTVGSTSGLQTYVLNKGSFQTTGAFTDFANGAVRPAMWIEIGN